VAAPILDGMLPPGSTIGILGGGQLGRMLAQAAASLGLDCHIYAPEAGSPAFAVSAARTVAPYEDETALRAFAASVDVITYEFENVPAASVRLLESLKPVRPGAKALEVAQDRLAEKALAWSLGARTAAFAPVNDAESLAAAIAAVGLPAVLKTTRMGYDGKGQAKIRTEEEAGSALAAMRGQPAILEAFIAFEREVSVVAARGLDGAFQAFDVTENEHRDHILHRSVAPARLSEPTARQAVAVARSVAEALDYVGVFAVEFFVTGNGADETLFVNEIAPRVHNSGHWTLDGAICSQFEQHVRAAAGWPLGSPDLVGRGAEMINLIGDEAGEWRAIASDPDAKLHLYGKGEARPGRKMGHVNRLLR
jgi:5-(carboxyamino)imidazole ribonucleotide synthase